MNAYLAQKKMQVAFHEPPAQVPFLVFCQTSRECACCQYTLDRHFCKCKRQKNCLEFLTHCLRNWQFAIIP